MIVPTNYAVCPLANTIHLLELIHAATCSWLQIHEQSQFSLHSRSLWLAFRLAGTELIEPSVNDINGISRLTAPTVSRRLSDIPLFRVSWSLLGSRAAIRGLRGPQSRVHLGWSRVHTLSTNCNMADEEGENVKVAVRVRPFISFSIYNSCNNPETVLLDTVAVHV